MERMEKQTAVEWLIQEHFGEIENCTPYFRKHIKQAVEMKKDLQKKQYNAGHSDAINKVKRAIPRIIK